MGSGLSEASAIGEQIGAVVNTVTGRRRWNWAALDPLALGEINLG